MRIVEGHEFKWSEKTKWEEEQGVRIVGRDPFRIAWENSTKKEAFYEQHLTKDEYELYEIMRGYAHIITTGQEDFFGFMGPITHRKENHSTLMDLMEKRNPVLYASIRLLEVTGSYLTERHEYVPEVEVKINAFIDEEKSHLKKKIFHAIEQDMKELYEKWKKEMGI